MRKIIATCSMGNPNSEHEEELVFSDDTSAEEIDMEVWEWGTQFLETSWEKVPEI